jgi:hypothetical protein
VTIAPLPLEVRNPIKAHVAAARQDAQKQLHRMTALDGTELTALRAKRLLHKSRALLAFLNRTDPAAGADDGIPDRDTRDRLVAQRLAELTKLAKRARRRERPPTRTTKETPMPTNHCVVEGHPRHEGGCIIDDPHATPPPPPPTGPEAPGIPLALRPEIDAFEGVFHVPNPDPVRRQRALRLARTVLDFAERDRDQLLAALFYRFKMRSAR